MKDCTIVFKSAMPTHTTLYMLADKPENGKAHVVDVTTNIDRWREFPDIAKGVHMVAVCNILGDLRCDASHHDGTNHYLYRVYKDGVTETQIDNLKDKIYCGKATRADITRVTRRLGDDIAKVYGFSIFRGAR